jgi:hypothetical protein
MVLTWMDALAFIVDGDGYIGRGVWQEINDASDRAIPIHFLHDGQLTPLAAIQFRRSVFDNYQQYAQVLRKPNETPSRADGTTGGDAA